MNAQSVITHALKPGARMQYVGTQSWGPRVVTVVKAWGGASDPGYVVAPDGMGGRTYVAHASDMRPVGEGVSLGKVSDRLSVRGLPVEEPRMRLMPIGVVPGLGRNDLRALRVAFDVMGRGLNPSR